MTDCRQEGETTHITLVSGDGVDGLTLLLPENVTEVKQGNTGGRTAVDDVELEGRTQRAVTLTLPAGHPVVLSLHARSAS